MIAAQHPHEVVLNRVDVLKLVNHDVFKPLLPLEADVPVLLEEVEREFEQVVVVKAKALFLLAEVAVEDDVRNALCAFVLLAQGVVRQGDEVEIVFGLLEQLLHFNHVAGGGEAHVAQREAALLIDELQHGVDVGIVEHEEVFGVLQGVAVFL